MAEDDIYGSKEKYRQGILKLNKITEKPDGKVRCHVLYCKNKSNLRYFKKLIPYFEAKDLSYIRRLKYFEMLKLICWATEKDLKDCDRDDINSIMAVAYKRLKSPESILSLIRVMRCIWKYLFPEKDSKGRIEDTVIPYQIRHVSSRLDRSKIKSRPDRLTWTEYEKIIAYLSNNPCVQAFIALATESLGRPQEVLWRRIKDLELHENYGKVWVSDHGKEGSNGFLQSIDSYPYLLKWLELHPLRSDPQAFIFVNRGNKRRNQQMLPKNINNILKKACRDLKIDKPITIYSFKRSGVTFRRERGDSDFEIQHAARWTSTRQLARYDLTTQQDALNKQLQKRGIAVSVDSETEAMRKPQQTLCPCGNMCSTLDDLCSRCRRPLNRKSLIAHDEKKDEEINNLRLTVERMSQQLNTAIAKVQDKADNMLNDLEKQGVIKST